RRSLTFTSPQPAAMACFREGERVRQVRPGRWDRGPCAGRTWSLGAKGRDAVWWRRVARQLQRGSIPAIPTPSIRDERLACCAQVRQNTATCGARAKLNRALLG